MFNNRLLLLILTLIFSVSSGANESDDTAHLDEQPAADTQADLPQKSQLLNLSIDPQIIKEPEASRNSITKQSNQLLPDIFRDKQTEKDVSMKSGFITNDDGASSEFLDGAEISIKVKTD